MALLKIVSSNPDFGYVIRKNPNKNNGRYSTGTANSSCTRCHGLYENNELGHTRHDSYLVSQIQDSRDISNPVELKQLQSRSNTGALITAIRRVLTSALKDENALDIECEHYIELQGITLSTGAGVELLSESRIVRLFDIYDSLQTRRKHTVVFKVKGTIKEALNTVLLYLHMEMFHHVEPTRQEWECVAELITKLDVPSMVQTYGGAKFRTRPYNINSELVKFYDYCEFLEEKTL